MAASLGVSRQRVHEWQTGRKQPDLAARKKIEAVIGVPYATWDHSLHESARETRATVEGPSIIVMPPAAPLPKVADPTPPEGLVKTSSGEVVEQSLGRANLTDLLIDVKRRRMASQPGPERNKLYTIEANLIKQLVAAEEKELARQTDLFTSQVFLDFLGRTLDALAEWPEAIDKLEKVWGLG